MSNTIPLPEPYGRVTMHTVSGLEFFYRHPEPPYLDTAKSCTVVYTWEALHAHAAAVSAAKDAEIAGLLEKAKALYKGTMRQAAEIAGLREKLALAETVRASQVEGLTAGIDRLQQEVREISGGAGVYMGLLVDCIAVLHTIEPESDYEAEKLRDLLDAIDRALEPTRHKGELL